MRYFQISLISLILLGLSMGGAKAQQRLEKHDVLFCQEGPDSLYMTLYEPIDSFLERPTMLFVFGGGFISGERDAEKYQPFFRYFAERGYNVATIDYRLGLKGAAAPTIFNQKPLIRSIEMAVEDLYHATRYLLDHARELKVDTNKLILSGSSAGAITVLEADYVLNDNEDNFMHQLKSMLPEGFRYAGVVSFAGAIYSKEGTPSYDEHTPAPTLFFHGSKDDMVPYGSIRFFSRGMFGSERLSRAFTKKQYPHQLYSMMGMGHDVAEYPMQEYLPLVEEFLRDFVLEGRRWIKRTEFTEIGREPDRSLVRSSFYSAGN